MKSFARRFLRLLAAAFRDLLPIAMVITFFQLVVLQQPFPNIERVLIGILFVVVGLTLFVRGLEMGLFPLGEAMADAFARKGSLTALLTFAFALGFGTTVAEPALIAVAAEGARAAAEAEVIPNDRQAMSGYAFQLRLTVAVSVGLALVIGVFRILKGWPIHYLIIGGYIVVVALTTVAPPEVVGIAYDSGGVTTSTITVPLVTALGVGLATVIRGRNPAVDGFGLIAFASLTPMMFVLIFGMVGGAVEMELIHHTLATLATTILDVAPIVAILVVFQLLVLRRRLPNLRRIVAGFIYVVVGLGLFLVGLEEALFPLGKTMAMQLTAPEFIGSQPDAGADWRNYLWVYVFAAAIGFTATVAEPALIAVSLKARDISGGAIHVFGLRLAVAFGVAVGVALGAFRIVTGTSLPLYIIAGYVVVILQTFWSSRTIIPLAYDSGGVTTSTVTVPVLTALGLGLASTIPGRSPLIDGFGLIAFASVFPIMSVLAYASLTAWMQRVRGRTKKKETTR